MRGDREVWIGPSGVPVPVRRDDDRLAERQPRIRGTVAVVEDADRRLATQG